MTIKHKKQCNLVQVNLVLLHNCNDFQKKKKIASKDDKCKNCL